MASPDRRMFGIRNRRNLFIAACIALCTASGCAHVAAIPHASTGAIRVESAHTMRADTPSSGRLHTWMNVPASNSWDGNPNIRTMLDFAVVNQSVSAGQQSQRLSALGVTAIEYTNPNRQAASGDPNPEYSTDEDTFAHPASLLPDDGECYPNPDDRLYRMNNKTRYFQMEPDDRHLAHLWADELVNFTSPTRPPRWRWAYGGARSFVFEDVADNVDNLNGSPCNFGDYGHWTALSIDLIANADAAYRAQTGQDMPSVIYNGLDPVLSSNPRPAIGLNASPFVAGGSAENCYVRAAGLTTVPVQDLSPDHAPWSALESTEIAMAQAQKLFVCVGEAPPGRDASRLTHQRLYQLASFLLTFDPNSSILGEAYPTKSHFQVFPESLLAPTNPVQSQPATIADLVIASSGGNDLYGREYSACPVSGVDDAGCFVVVNPSTAAIAFAWPSKYVATVKLSGSDFLDPPAKLTTSGPSPPAIVAAGTAVIALP
jgi:hypothetical protein